jgi:putative ABC transport system ATP-binding protein
MPHVIDGPKGPEWVSAKDVILEMLRRLNKDLGQTIVMITHNPEATVYFDRVVHMRDGVIVDGVPAD